MGKKPSALEQDLLDVLLNEVRRAVKKKTQMTVIIDPWVAQLGMYVHVSFNEIGSTYQIEPAPRKKRKAS